MNASRAHTLVHGINHHGAAARLERAVNGVRNLRRHSFLGLKALGENLNNLYLLGNANNFFGWQISHIGRPKKRRHMVFAVALHIDLAQNDHIVIA